MLTSQEEHTLRTRLLSDVVPYPHSVLDNFTSWFDSDEDAAEFTQPLEEFAEALVAEFEGDEIVYAAARALEQARWRWVSDQGWSDEEPDDSWRYDAPRVTRPLAHGHRSVFDDLVEDPS